MGEAKRRGAFGERRAAARIRDGYGRTINAERPPSSQTEERLACLLEWALVAWLAALAVMAVLAVGRQAARAWRERRAPAPGPESLAANIAAGVYGDEMCGFIVDEEGF
jgi:hypothetical protein